MFNVNLPNTEDYHDLYALTGITEGTSLIVTNSTSKPLLIVQTDLEQPENENEGFQLMPKQTALVHGNDMMKCMCKGPTVGYITVQMLTSTVMPLIGVEFAQDIVTSGEEGFRRLQVDQGQTGFFEAREFRMIKKIEFTGTGQTRTFKFTSNVDFILFEQQISVSSGSFEFYAWRDDNINELTPFTTPVNFINKNISSEYRDYNGGRYQSQVIIEKGGTIDVIDEDLFADYADMRTSNATSQRITVGGPQNTQRYLAAGTYYLQFVSLNNEVKGVYQIGWEERPPGVK